MFSLISELRKVSKKLFSPPLNKPSIALAKGEPALHRKQEDGQANPVPLSHPAGSGSAAKPLKAHYPKANAKVQEKKQKGSTKVVKGAKQKKGQGLTEDVIGQVDLAPGVGSGNGKWHRESLEPQHGVILCSFPLCPSFPPPPILSLSDFFACFFRSVCMLLKCCNTIVKYMLHL